MSGSGDGVRLDGSWPGLRVPDGSFEVDPDELDAVAENLLELVKELRAADHAGSLHRFSNDASLPPGSFGGWVTAVEMESGYSDAYYGMLAYYAQLISSLDQTARELQEVARFHREGDAASGAGMDTQTAALDNERSIPVV